MDLKAAALGELKKRVISLQKQMTSRILAMAAEVEKLQEIMPAKEAREFLRVTCNLPATELSTYTAFAEKLKGSEHLLERARASFPVVKALVATEDDARAEVLARMDLGARIDEREISAIRKRLRAAKLTPFHAAMERHNKTIRAAARRKAATTSDAFQSKLQRLVLLLEKTAWKDRASVRGSEGTRREAASLRDECLGIFGEDLLWADPSGRKAADVVTLGFQALCSIVDGKEFAAPKGNRFSSPDYDLLTALRKMSGMPTSLGGWDGRGRVLDEQPPHHVKLRVLELCAGAGGMSLGLERAGFTHTALYEFDKEAAATLRRNRPDWNVITDDIRKVDFRPYRGKNIALVAGGIPCQPYSQQGSNPLGKNDPRDLLPEAVRVVKEVLPAAFLFENVTGLLNERHADHLAAALHGFRRAGYQTEIHRVNVSDFGIAQSRTRILIVGLRREYSGALRMPPAFPARRANIGDALVDLLSENGWSGAAQFARELSQRPVVDGKGNIVAIGAQAATLITSQGEQRSNANAVWDGLGFDMSNLSVHAPTEKEAAVKGFKPGLTLRMKARLQNLPDDWKFVGGKASVTKQVGNAVPPRLAQAAGLAIFGAIRNMQIDWEAMLWPEEKAHREAVEPPSLDMDLGHSHGVVSRVLESS